MPETMQSSVRGVPTTPAGMSVATGVRGSVLRTACLVLALISSTAPIRAQGPGFDGERVVRLTFRGVHSVDPLELGASLATEAGRCRTWLYQPLCWTLDSPLFEHKPVLDEEELARDEIRIRVFYFRRGWRDVEARSEIQASGEGVLVTFHVTEGSPTRIDTLLVHHPPEVVDTSSLDLPRVGEPLDLTALDSLRVRTRVALWDRGYADALIRDTTRVDDAADLARLELTIDPGSRTTVGRVELNGNERISDGTLRRLVDLPEGRILRRRELLDAQRRLYRSELFSQAIITVPDQADSAKTLDVTVSEAPFRALRLGLGFTTQEFGQAQTQLTRYHWFGGARRLDIDASVANLLAPQLYGQSFFGGAVPTGIGHEVDDTYLNPTWRVSAKVTQPWLFGLNTSLGLGIFAHRRSVPGIVVDQGWGGEASLTHGPDERIPISLAYRYERTRVDAGEVYFCSSFGVCRPETADAIAAEHSLSPLIFGVDIQAADDPLAPTRGLQAHLALEHASSLTGSDFRYNRVAGELAHYWPVGDAVLAVHVRAGWVRPLAGTLQAVGLDGDNPGLLYPRKRFYAGGTRSVRGYAENQLGPRVLIVGPDRLLDPADSTALPCTGASLESGACHPGFVSSSAFQPRPFGGDALIEGGVEVRFPITRILVGAVFLDAGHVSATDGSLASGRSAVTPGVGVRYQSPVGPIRIDLGLRPGLTEDLPVVTQVGEGEDARLIVLDTPKRYDPLEDSGGFIRNVFSRLQLHLAIGEAF